MMKVFFAFFLIVASVMAFNAPGAVRPAKMTMLFNLGKKPTQSYKVGEGTAVSLIILFYSDTIFKLKNIFDFRIKEVTYQKD